MNSVLPITTRNYHAKLVLNNGTRLVLREVLFGEQMRLSNGRFATAVTPMKDGRFRLIQYKHEVRSPIDLHAQHVDKLTRRGSTGGLGPMPRPQQDIGVFDVVHQGLFFAGQVHSFLGRAVIHGTDDKTGLEKVVLLDDVQIMEVKRRRPEPRRVRTDAEAVTLDQGEGETMVEVSITAADLTGRPEPAEYLVEQEEERPGPTPA